MTCYLKFGKSQVFYVLLTLVSLISYSCRPGNGSFRSSIDLSGKWEFSLDSANVGIKEAWYDKNLTDSIQLPGTTDQSGKGYVNTDTTTKHLSRVLLYEGAAWYRKNVVIPMEWKSRHVQLILERTKPSKIWVDSHYIGESALLQSAQKYDLSKFLTPGQHTITVRVDNTLALTPYGNVHIYSDETQTNWNGILGSIALEASDMTYITQAQVFADIANKKIKVRVGIHKAQPIDDLNIELHVTKYVNDEATKLASAFHTVRYDSVIELDYLLGDNMDLWDEYHQPLYKLNVIISNKHQFADNVVVPFGMRKFSTKQTHFTINGRVTFLRGKHDACVFPLTGHPPMDTAGWMRVFKIAKSYGINHYRFHSWCPSEAAFEAADRVGMYLQPELPFWGGLTSDTVAAKLKDEGIALLKSYANHPSFVMFSMGNEIWSGYDHVKKILDDLKAADSRPLYTQGSNNAIGFVAPMAGTDYQTAARTPYAHDTTLTHTRLTHAFADSKDGGILNTRLPSANVNFDYAVSQLNVPLISHEIGQYQIYPDYDEIKKYTGVVRAWNLEVFKKGLQKSGMLDQNKAFTKASGALSVLCYRAEIEAALRTGGLGGFQLLDLQDFPGQGSALVGILDAFMDSKNVVERKAWLQFCNDVVPLLVYEKYIWTTNETFSAAVKVANYSNRSLKNDVKWKITNARGQAVKTGTFNQAVIPFEGLHEIGKLEFPLANEVVPQKFTVTLSIEGTAYENSFPIWVYPQPVALKNDADILVASDLSKKVFSTLNDGGNVLFFPSAKALKNNSLKGLFPPDFWNYGMFKGISEWAKKPISPGTLGLLVNPGHPLFKSFPTDSYSNWQWWSIVKNSNALILNTTPHTYKPIVQVIDNMERNNKLGLIFEMSVGKGKLLVCTSALNTMHDRPEAVQLYRSIVNYMKSDQFKPDYVADEKLLLALFQ